MGTRLHELCTSESIIIYLIYTHKYYIQLVPLVPTFHPPLAHAQTARLTVSARRKGWLSVRVLTAIKGVNQNKERRTCHAQVAI